MGKKAQSDRRQFGRRETLLHAIAYVPGRGALHCTVSNLSEQGAPLTVSEPASLPPIFRLEAEAIGLERICNVRHQGPSGIGVQFVDHATAQKITAKLGDAASRQHYKQKLPPADGGVRLREELQTARDAHTKPEDMRALNHVPGPVIRGV